MSDERTHSHDDCARFADWLLESPTGNAGVWRDHIDRCAECREQWVSHRILVAAFASEDVPELSPAFQAGLDRKLETAVRVKPLTGWRRVALVVYAAIAIALMNWVLGKFPLPEISIDATSPWTIVTAMLVVPLSLWLTMLATRLLPRQRPKGAGLFAF